MYFHSKMTSYVWILLLAGLVATRAQDLDLSDALFDDDKPPTKPPVKPVPPKNEDLDPKKPSGDVLDLTDAFGPDTEPKKPVVKPPSDGGAGGGSLDDNDLLDLGNGGSEYKPDAGQNGGGGSDPGHEGGASDQSQGGGGTLAAIISSVGVALLGAASSYFAYQKKKLCFKTQGEQDPESGKNQRGAASDNQVFSNLLRSS